MESGGLALLEKREKEGCDLPTWFSSIMTRFEQGVPAGVRGWDTVMGGGREVREGMVVGSTDVGSSEERMQLVICCIARH